MSPVLPLEDGGQFIRQQAEINWCDPVLGNIFTTGRELKMRVERVVSADTGRAARGGQRRTRQLWLHSSLPAVPHATAAWRRTRSSTGAAMTIFSPRRPPA